MSVIYFSNIAGRKLPVPYAQPSYLVPVQLTDDLCYKALTACDPRFDGVFFAGVSTTGIYCRSVCPAKKPKRESCTFYPNAASAEREGFRPCLRCRPELAPGLAPCDASRGIASGIIARIHAGAMNNGAGVDALAREFALSARQLRRLVREHGGVSPIELAQTSRLLLAKQLLSETSLPVTRVAFASGFASLRRFNQAFKEHYRLSPSDLRKSQPTQRADGTVRLRLAYRPPLDFNALLSFLATRAIAGVEHVGAGVYMRTVAIGEHHGWLRVTKISGRDALEAEISSTLSPVLQQILAGLSDLFDLHARPDIIDAHLSESNRLAPLVRERPGLRVPGAFIGFELAWRAVLGQQISVRGASTLSARLASEFGEPIETPIPELTLLSPTSEKIGGTRPDRIAKIGLPIARAKTLRSLAALASREPQLLRPGAPVERTTERLLAIPGIGPWTASYIAMRALRWPDAFPDSDLGLKKALEEPSPTGIRKLAEPWRPWRAYAAMHLWNSLAKDTKP